MDSKESSRESRDRSRSDHSSKSRESSQSGSRSESREKSKSESRSSKSEYSKSKSDSKHSSSKSESPDKKSKQDGSQAPTDKSRQGTSPGEPEHKAPIRLKLSLAKIYSSYVSDDSNDSATSNEEYEEPRKRTKSRREGSSKKKKSKDKRKSKSTTVDPDTLAPPELELMETGESTQISEAEASLLTDPEPLALQEETMDLPPESLPGASTLYQDSEDMDSQQTSKMCAFCACGERSLLGQGSMDHYDPTPGYNAFRKSTQKSSKKLSSEVEDRGQERGPKPLTSRRNRTSLKTTRDDLKSPRQPNDDHCEGFDELATVGYPEDTDVSTVIEPSGHVWAHHCCAAWSEGVLQTEDFMLQYVDKAVVMGLSKRCSYCLRYGATINCRYSKCNKIFHYPCASAGGCFQDIRSLSLLCPDHTDEAQTIAGEEALCVVCNIVGNIHEQLFCTSCGHHYHAKCLHPPVEVNPIVRAGWQCPDCKICQMCRQPGDDSKMLVCDMCDKGYHTFCLKPVMTTIPKNGWKCKNCRVCEDCGSRTPGSGRSSRWHLNYTVCDSCYQQRNKGLSCPLCGKAYRHFSQKAMVQCNLCKKLVHSECDDTIDAALLLQVKNEEVTDYMCTICRNRDPEMDMPDFPLGMIEDSSDSMIMQKTAGLASSEMLDEYGEDSQHTSDFLLNEDSLSSMDLDLNILEKMSPTYTMAGLEGEVSHGKGKLVAMARKKMSLIAAKTKNRQLAPEKRKRPLTFGEKRRAPKPKIGGGLSSLGCSKKNSVETDDDEDDHPNTLILARKDDGFVLNQDVCKSCGSFGQGDEGRLIVCTQCGQCYHPYCANIKVTKIVIQKGWRCLDCTVCEGCGQPHDEGRLLLCDDCDISYHTYCLDPPLDHVPKGTWKCKWCVMCLICGATSPGFGCQWQRNYTHCGPCHSKISCPVCRMRYHEEELIIQCVQCDRWLHAFCDGIHNEDDAERAADFGYHCIFCRPRTGQPGPLPPPPPSLPSPPAIEKYLQLPLPLPPPPPKEPEPPRFYLVDGVLLSTAGRNLIENIKMEAPKIKRNRRWGKKPEGWDDKRGEIEKKMEELMAERVSQDSDTALIAPTISRMLSVGSADDEDKESEDFKSPDEAGPDGELGPTMPDPHGKQTIEAAAMAQSLELQAMALLAEEKKQKKKRNVSRLGVGGFVVKPRLKPRAKRQQSLLDDELEALPRPREGEEGFPGMPMMEDDKPRKRRQGLGQGRRKSQLQENFPSYMQEAFFGKEILDRSKDTPLEGLKALESDEDKSRSVTPKSLEVKEDSKIAISSEPILQQISEKQKQAAEAASQSLTQVPTDSVANEEPDLELDDLGIDIEEDFLKMFGDEILQEEMESEPDDTKPKDQQQESDNLDLPHLDEKNMDIDSILSDGLAQIDSKTVEDIFKGVWQGPEGQAEAPTQPQPPQPPQPIPGQHPQHPQHPAHPSVADVNYPVPLPSPSHPPPEHQLPHHPYPPQFPPEHMGGQHPPPFDHSFPPAWPQAMTDDSSGQDSSRRNMLKWESDEDMGPNATISPILYCNLIHPELKQQYPDWQERSKQIAKIWRKLTADEKQPYLLKARKNRGTYKAKTQTKVTPEQRRKKAEAVMGQMGMHPGEVFPSPEGPPGMQSPMHPGPGGMQSPLRPGAAMMPGTPEGQSPSHSLSGMSESPGHPVPLPGFQGPEHPFQKQPSVGDPYAHMPPASRPQDPYSMPPPTPRGPMGEQFPQTPGTPRGPVPEQFGHSPTGRLPADPYSQPPSTPRATEHTPPHEQYRSPVKDPYMHSPGVAPGMEHFMQPPGTPRPQLGPRAPLQHHPTWPQGQEGDPYERQPQTPFSAPGTPRPMGPQAGVAPGAAGLRPLHPLGPRFMRQRSEPGAGAVDDPYAFPPATPGMEGQPHPRMSVADAFSVPPGPHQAVRMPERQMSLPADGQMPPNSLGPFRHPFRPPAPHTTQSMMRLPNIPHDPYSQQPATPRPGIEQPGEMHPGLRPPEPSALQQMYAAANRRQIFPPLSRMWPISLAQTLATGAQTDIQKQQLREILAQQTKLNLKKKEQQGSEMYPQGQEAGFTEPRPPGMPGARLPMMPPGSQAPTQPGPMQFPRGMRPPFDLRPPGELTPEERKRVLEYFTNKVKEQAVQHGHILPGQHPGAQGAPPTGVTEADAQPGEEVPGTSKDGLKRPAGAKVDGRIPKPSVSSEEEKTDDADELGDFLGEDGTFDILKYADPDLDLGSDNKTIFDDLVYDSKEHSEKKDEAEENKQELKSEEKPIGEDGEAKTEDGEKPGSVSEFQAKFLEFSQRKQAGNDKSVKSELDKQEGGVSHITAILQNAERGSRPQSVKSEGAEGMDAHTPTTPGTPMTPGGQDPNAIMASRAQGQFGPGLQSPAHPGLYAGQGSTQPSPGGSGFGQPNSGLPSPKFQPSPKSQPSPRTPGDSSVQGQQQMSPFSQHSIQSPFSPNAAAGQSPYAGTPTSAPQSPFAGMRPQSPFAVPGTSGGQQQIPPHMSQASPLPTSYSPGHTPPTAFPMQRSPRAPLPPGNQYIPGTFPQPPFGPGVPPRGTLTPSPGAIPYGKPGMRPQGPPGSVPGIHPPASGPVTQQQSPGQQAGADLQSPGIRPPMPGMRPQFPPGHPGGPPVSPGQQVGMYPQGVMPGQRPGVPGQQMPPFIGQQGMTRPPAPVSAAASVTTAAGQRASLLEDQPLLIQDLLEQEKQEQQKRQAEQRAIMHRREAGVHPEGMPVPRPGMPPPPGMVPRMEGPVRHPGQPGPSMFIPPEMAPYRPRVPGQLSPRTPGPQPGMMGMQPGGLRMPAGPPPMPQPPKPPTPGETGPEAEQQHLLYDTWLVRQGEYLEGHVKFLEQQIQKQKRTKKAINARNRQAKKNGQEMPQQDAMELDRATQDQAILQKQLEQARKQNRQHQMLAQEYRSKQQEHFSQQMAAQGQPPPMPGPQAAGAPMPPASTPASTPMQPPPPRIPGAQGSARLTASARQEYEAYMQNRLRMMGPQGMPGGPRMPGPPPGVIPQSQPRMAIGDNNPFSEEFQEREQLEKLRESQGKQIPPTGPLEKQEEPQEIPVPRPFPDPRFPGQPGPTTQPQRFPGPHEQQPWMPPRFPFDPATGQRLPGPGDPRFQGPFPQGPPGQVPPQTQGPNYPTVAVPEIGHPPPVPQPMDGAVVSETKEKTKKRKKKKKAENAQTPPTNQPPPGKPPPIQFKPHDETERRIMEILNSTANLQRVQSPGSAAALPVSSAPQASQVHSPATSAPDSSGKSVTMATSESGQPTETVTSQPVSQAGSPHTVLQPAKTPPVQGRLTPGQTAARSPAGLSAARSPAAQQGRQTPGSAPHTPLPHPRPQTPGSVTPQGRLTPGSAAVAPAAQQGRQTPGAMPPASVAQPGLQVPGSGSVPPTATPGTIAPTQPVPQQGDVTVTTQQPGAQSSGSVPPSAVPPSLHPAPPALQHAPSSHPQSTVTTVTGPPSLQAAPHVRPPMSVPQSVQGPPGMQQGPPGMPVSHPGLPPGHPLQSHPGFPRHLLPGMVPQRPEQGHPMMQRPGFPPMEHMPGILNRPPMLPHWSAPRQEFPQGGGQARRSPRPALPSMNTLARMGMPHLSMRQGVPHLTGGPFSAVASGAPTAAGEHQVPVTAHTSQDDPGLTTIPAGIPRSSPETSLSQPVGLPTHVIPSTDSAVHPTPKGKDEETKMTEQVADPTTKEEHQVGGREISVEAIEKSVEAIDSSSEKIDKQQPTEESMESTSNVQGENTSTSQECSDGIHCGTPPPKECTDGKHCGTPPPQECTDGLHCGTPPPQECTDGKHCGTPPPQECADGLHCGTPPPQECTDGLHCGTPPPQECTDGLHCGTPPPQECTDGLHCGTPPPQACTYGLHCGTPPPQACTDGLHCGTPPPPQECSDGLHCGTPPPQECTDGLHCGTPPPQECSDGLHCGTPPPQECTDGLHCGTPPPQECTDGLHCGTPPPQECTDGLHCGTPPPPPQECTDGLHCGTPPPQECTDGLHCGTPPPQECTDGLHCGTPPPQECTDGLHCGTPPPQECTDGLHCGIPPPQECTDGLHCGTPPPQECPDGEHCGTPPPQECTDGKHCGTPPPQECTDGRHCGTPPPQGQGSNESQSTSEPPPSSEQPIPSSASEQNPTVVSTHDAPPSLQPVMLSPQHSAVQADHQYVNVSQPPVLLPSHSTSSSVQESSEKLPAVTNTTPSISCVVSSETGQQPTAVSDSNVAAENIEVEPAKQPLTSKTVSSQSPVTVVKDQSPSVSNNADRNCPSEPTSHQVEQPTSTEITTVAGPSHDSGITSGDHCQPREQVQSLQQDGEKMHESSEKPAVQVQEPEKVQTEMNVSQAVQIDVKDRPKTITPVIEPVSSLVHSKTLEKSSPSQPPTDIVPVETDATYTGNQNESLPKETSAVPDPSSHLQNVAKPVLDASQTQSSAGANEVKVDDHQADTSVQCKAPVATSEEQVLVTVGQQVHVGTSQQASASDSNSVNVSAVKPIPSTAEIKDTPKLPAVSEIKQEEQATPTVSGTSAHLTSVPRPRHFGPVANIDDVRRQMHPGQMPGRPPYPGFIPGRHPSQPQDLRQGYPPVSQPTGHPRQPQPAHFHESQLHFMQQMYHHQLAQGQRPRAAHQAGQPPYAGPHMYRGPMPGQPGFPPHFYQQHPNMVGQRQQHPNSTQAGAAPAHSPDSDSKLSSPKDPNLQRLPVPQPAAPGQTRHLGPNIPEPGHRHPAPSEYAARMSGPVNSIELSVRQPPPGLFSEPGIKPTAPGPASEHAIRHSGPTEQSGSQVSPAIAAENAPKHPLPGAVSEHDGVYRVPGIATEANKHPASTAAEHPVRYPIHGVEHPERYPHPGIPSEHLMRYPRPGIAMGRPPGPWPHASVRLRYPGPGPGGETLVRHPGIPSETTVRQSTPGFASESTVRPQAPVSASEHAVKHPSRTLDSTVRHSSPVTASEQVEKSQPGKSTDIPTIIPQAIVKEEPMDYQHASCASLANKRATPDSSQQSQDEKEKSVQEVPTSSSGTSIEQKNEHTSQNGELDSSRLPTSIASSSTESPIPVAHIKTEVDSSETTVSAPSTLSAPLNTSSVVSQPQEPASTRFMNVSTDHQHVSPVSRPLSGHRQSPGQSQGQVPDTMIQSTSELTLPSVSATFAAAGMMRYGEGMHPGLPPYGQGHYRLHPSMPLSTHGPGFSSVSSIVQSVSSVSFPGLSGKPAQHHVPASVPPAEVSLPPSTGVSLEAVSSVGASASTQTPVHHKTGPHPGMVPGQPVSSAATTEQVTAEARPPSTGSSIPSSQPPRPGHPPPDMQGPPGAPGVPGPHGPRMPVPHSAAQQPATQPGHVPRPRGPRQSQQHANQGAMSRYPRIPSNLPPHLAGMLNNMRGPMPPRHMFPQERHPGMPPMGPMRFPQGGQVMHPMGPAGYRMPVSQDGSQMPMTSVGQMQVPAGAARHPGMMPQGMVMRPGMRMVGPGGPMMGPHPMQPPHPGPMSPTGHPGAPPPHMHPRMVQPATAAGPLMGPPGMPQPSGHPSPKESQSPTQAMTPRPPTPGSMPSTPSPTSFHPGMMPTTSGAPSMAPGLPGEMHPRHRFPGQRMPMRMPFDGRMPFDPNMNMAPRLGMEGMQRPPGLPPDFQAPGFPQVRPGQQETPQSPSGPFEDPMKRMAAGKPPGPSPTPPQPGSKSATPPVGSETTSASTTPPSPLVNIKQEQNLDPAFGLDPSLASQNALLKKLLAKSNAHAQAAAAAMSGQSTPQSTDQSEDSNDFSNIQLTPEQQRQLELIEKMPLLKETHPGEASFMAADSGDPDIEAKRLEFERRRKEMEELRKQKKVKDGPPRKRKKKNQVEGQMIPGQLPGQGHSPGFDPMMLASGDKGQQVDLGPSPEKVVKKRMRRTKKEKLMMEEGNLDGAFDLFMQQLKQIPPVPLMEPLVSHMYAICSLPGMSATTNTENQGHGTFGKVKLEGEPDYYGDSGGNYAPAVGLSKPRDIAGRRQLISDKPDISDQQRYLMMMDSIMDRNEGQTSTSPFGLGSQLLGMPKGAPPTLPPPPRVEPRVNVPKGTSDSPDSVISSSSPETGFGESAELPDYPMLRPIDPAVSDEETRTSPAVPLLQPVPVKVPPFMVKQEKLPAELKPEDRKPAEVPIPAQKGKEELDSALSALAGKENIRAGDIDPLTGLIRGGKDPKSDQEVSVTLTLSAKAAEDIGGVLSAIADLLKIAAPPTYEVSRSPSPVQHRLAVEKHKEESLNVHNLARTKHFQMYCRHCETAILHSGIQKKKSEIPHLTKEELEGVGDYMRFCSMNCYTNFSITRQMTQHLDPKDLPPAEPKGPFAMSLSKDPLLFSPREMTPSSSGQLTPSSVGTESILAGEVTPTKSGPPTPMLTSPTMMRQLSQEKLGKRTKASPGLTEPPKPQVKKWKGVRYKKFEPTLFPEVTSAQKKDEDESQLWKKLTQAITYLDMESEDRPKDFRMCEFCNNLGDGPSDGTARLLNMDIDKWAHLNCALWSYEVYETLNGALMNVQQAYTRGLKQKCVVCVNMGATLTCFKQRCNNIYHVECAKLVGCVFFEDKTILCPPHSKIPMEQVLKSLVVYRRVYINRDEDTQVANMLLQEDGNYTLRLGSITLNNIGQLLPHQIGSGKFNTRDHMYPVGYKATRLYWSMKTLYKRCNYVCSIHDKEGRPEFQVKVVEEGQQDMTLISSTCKGVWKTVLEPVEKMHKEADLVKVFPNFTSGEEFYGLNDPNIVRLIESLPGTDLQKDYIFKFGRRQLIDLPLTINPTGCARAEPKLRTHFRKPHITLQSSSSHHSLPSSVTGLSGDLNSPYMKHFVHSKSQQYRRLKTEWKNLVYLGRSRIQGLGLYAARDLDQHTMVIEYIGELIRNEVANRREKIYEETNRGVYMFRIDDTTVVDATMTGGPARYINHSCDPNCQAEVVELDQPKIIIITNRRISKGEELTYDYQFDFEDDQHKIPCMCGAHCCRKWMN